MRVWRLIFALIILIVATTAAVGSAVTMPRHADAELRLILVGTASVFLGILGTQFMITELKYARGGLCISEEYVLAGTLASIRVGPISGVGPCLIVVRAPQAHPLGLDRSLNVTPSARSGLTNVRAARVSFGGRGCTSYEIRISASGPWVIDLFLDRRPGIDSDLVLIVEVRGRCSDVKLPKGHEAETEVRRELG